MDNKTIGLLISTKRKEKPHIPGQQGKGGKVSFLRLARLWLSAGSVSQHRGKVYHPGGHCCHHFDPGSVGGDAVRGDVSGQYLGRKSGRAAGKGPILSNRFPTAVRDVLQPGF